MAAEDPVLADLGRQIVDVHDRFTEVMRARLPGMDREQRERYLALVSMLVGKLEDGRKSMKQVLQEMVGEALPLVMSELSGS